MFFTCVLFQERTDEDEFLVLACDGVWDVMTNQVSFIRIHSLTVTRCVSARCRRGNEEYDSLRNIDS